jgi:3-hydroxyacyl-CoA dehydrogenase
MKLVEVVIAKQTSDETRDRSLAFVRQIGKLPVIVRDSPGFLVNRVLFPYLLDAAELFESGVDAERIDRVLVEWGMPMGPLRLIDEIGVDITIDIGNTLEKAYGQRDRVAAVLLWLRKCWAAKQAQVFTNTKARSRRLTIRWWSGYADCTVSRKGVKDQTFHRSRMGIRGCV